LLLVGKESPKDLTDLEKMTPVFVGSREPGKLSTEDDADLPTRHSANHIIESFTLSGAQGRTKAQIAVDDLDLLKAQRLSTVFHRILESLTLQIL
jgi:hypothetical protein